MYKKYNWLMPSLLFTLSLISIRVFKTQSIMFTFLAWNLFLGMLPLYFSLRCRHASSRSTMIAWLAVWLLFFPNSIYIVTDLFHLQERDEMPLWYDLVLLSSAAVNGIVYGMLSLHNIERKLRHYTSRAKVDTIIFTALFLCGYGIYLGRYMRWNSWDIITSPLSLMQDVCYHVLHPVRNHSIWLLSGVFGVWMYLLYNLVRKTINKSTYSKSI